MSNPRGRARGGGRGSTGDRGGRGSSPSSGHGTREPSQAGSERSGPTDSGGRGRGYDRGGGGRGFDRGGGGGRGRGGGVGGSVIFQESTPPAIPPRLSPQNLQQLLNSFKSMKVKPDKPLRPGYGTKGNAVVLRANFFPMKVPKGPIYDYVVEISPKTDINRIKGRLFDLLENHPLCQPHLSYIAHDRSQRLVSARKLPQPLDIHISYYEADESGPSPRSQTYTVSIRLDRELDCQRLTQYVKRDFLTSQNLIKF